MSDMVVDSDGGMVEEDNSSQCYQGVEIVLGERFVEIGEVDFGGLILFCRSRRIAAIASRCHLDVYASCCGLAFRVQRNVLNSVYSKCKRQV